LNRSRAAEALILACALALPAGAHAQASTVDEARRIVADQLLYPRQARYTVPSPLPSQGADAAANAQWTAVAKALAQAGLARVTPTANGTKLDGTEAALDVVVPSVNLRYETTALNVVLGRWDVEVTRIESRNGEVRAYGHRRLLSPTRAYAVVKDALPAAEAARLGDREATWRIVPKGGAVDVVEELR
jgi:hypothetical protein